MKKFSVIAFLGLSSLAIVSCGNNNRKPHRVYMPDMFYSRAYETYAERDSSVFTENQKDAGSKIFYNNKPVNGTIARGEGDPFPIEKDKAGDTTNYVASRAIPNPEPALTDASRKEAERLYLIYCGICHGAKLDGAGPLHTRSDGSDGPYAAAPANFIGGAKYLAMPDGQMFYATEYGFNMMGSYASQLSRKQRWEIIHYIKEKQAAATGTAAPAAATDSSATASK
ncbi:MAG: quinol:cytochrome C oxidoreductase [Pseudopedobacter saltans]|uniref:Quinol:cytochrome C oxidoreductase n=1 Tax=Pseudopedobacter saltans TaxID=151895 RepID=A0A2W5FB60_9SPHI|nr:MAG: quinol:cytochrome C oxidoreductase [Pseudopedobacter saltans]